MWVLVIDGLLYLAYGIATGHFRRDFFPVTPRTIAHDVWSALRFRLDHRLGHYNAVQTILYAGVLAVAVLTVLTGLSIWKPVQVGWLTNLFGGYPTARVLHFGLMCTIVGFLVVHLVLALLFPATILSMVTGGRKDGPHEIPPLELQP
jgi:thiosulfate reductase cytochrome b subunit